MFWKPAACLAPSALLLLNLALVAGGALAQSSASRTIRVMDRATFQAHLRTLGHKDHGGIDRRKSLSASPRFRSLPHFSSSFTVAGVSYPYTMLGYAPASGETAHLRSVIVPLDMHFVYFGQNGDVSLDFRPGAAVKNILDSPIYQDAPFPNGFGQFGDQLQRATFWNNMDAQRKWHVRMSPPRVAPTVQIEVTPETGVLYGVDGNYFGDVLFDFIDAEVKTILQLTPIGPDEVPIFVTGNVTAEALGYHDAFSIGNDDGTETLQTLIYTSWLDPELVDPLFADVSTFNHEQAEWLNDPYVNNFVPTWMYPPPTDTRTVCAGNPLLEVGDPQGNGPTYDDFPTYVVLVNGVTYHLQQVVMLPWFADQVPSSAEDGWYTFPIPQDLTVPAVYCR